MSGEITGREFVCALKQGSTWNTPVACGAGDGVLILSDNIVPSATMEDDDSAGQQWITDSDLGLTDCKGTLEMYGRYYGFDRFMALLFGSAAASQVDTSTAYLHTLTFASSIYGIFGTFPELKLSSLVWEYPSLKVHGVKIAGEANKPIKATFDVIADQLVRDSATNTTTTMASVTATKQNRIMMQSNAVFRINDASGIALASGDKIYPSSFELTISRPMQADAVAGQSGIAEPDDNGFPTITLMLKFPRYNDANDAYFDDWQSLTEKKVDITFTGREIETGYNYAFTLAFPNMRVANPEAPVSGAGKIPFSMTLNGYGTDTAPAGMTGITQPVRCTFTNERTTALLA